VKYIIVNLHSRSGGLGVLRPAIESQYYKKDKIREIKSNFISLKFDQLWTIAQWLGFWSDFEFSDFWCFLVILCRMPWCKRKSKKRNCFFGVKYRKKFGRHVCASRVSRNKMFIQLGQKWTDFKFFSGYLGNVCAGSVKISELR